VKNSFFCKGKPGPLYFIIGLLACATARISAPFPFSSAENSLCSRALMLYFAVAGIPLVFDRNWGDNNTQGHKLNMINKIKECFARAVLDSPWCRTIFGVVLPILSGIFTGTFVSEISTPDGLDWKLALTAKSTYILIVLAFVIYKYNKAIFLREKSIRQFLDTDYCIAYMRSQCLPEAAEQYKRLIRNGEGGQLKKAMDELKKILE
jgi:hypothetical protein